ncbi:12576_t:CDS:2, partial [Ambispora leptoticha]
LKAYCEIGYENPSFLRCHGISRDETGKYILVLKYAEMGSLNKNLSSIAKMRWKDKLKLLYCITSDLVAIHSQGLEHRDLHSGNILQDNLCSAYIADLGLSKTSKKFGVEHYIAPEVLMDHKTFTPAVDGSLKPDALTDRAANNAIHIESFIV